MEELLATCKSPVADNHLGTYNQHMNLRTRFHALLNRRQESILSASLVLAITFGVSAVLGFLRSRFLYAQFFRCCVLDLDAYNAAFRLPDLIFKLLVTGALSASFIPVFSEHLHRQPKKAYQLASAVINLLLVLFVIASVVVFIFAPKLSSLVAAGFNPEQILVMTRLTRVLLLAQIFFLISNFLTAILQVNQVFLVPALSPIIYNLFIIFGILTLTPTLGIYGAAYSAVVGAFFHLAIQIPSIRHLKFRYRPIFSLKLHGVREVIRLMIPRSLSLGLAEIENTVTLFFASSLAAGSISLLNLALQLIYLPSRIFGTTIGQASLPILSKNVAKNELTTFRHIVNRTILQSLFIALPISALVLINRVPIIRLAFGAKQFPWSATLITARTLALLVPAIACQAVIQILVRSFYALHDTRTPLKVSIVSLIVSVSTSFYFVNYTPLGILGLALSASLGNLAQFIGLTIFYLRAVDGHEWVETVNRAGRILLCSVFMGFVTWASHRFFDLFLLDTSRTLNLVVLFTVTSALGVASFLAACHFLQVSEYQELKLTLFRLKKPTFLAQD